MTKGKRKSKNGFKFLVLILLILWGLYLLFFDRFSFDDFKVMDKLSYDDVSSLKNSKGSIRSRLSKLSKEDGRIDDIIKDYDSYPEALLDVLSRDIDLLDFVLNYHDKSGKVFNESIKVRKGEIPLLLQWDERWGYASYGENIIAISGCAPTSLAMVASGLTGDSNITPYKVAKYAENNGFYIDGTGTSWNLMTSGSAAFGIKGKELSLSKNNVFNELENGHPIICSMREGDFTTQGHFIVLTGVSNGKIKVNDPNSKKRSSLLWDYDRLESQIKNLWSFSIWGD